MRPTLTLVAFTAVLVLATTRPVPSQGFDTPRTFHLVEATIPELVAALETHRINSKQLVKLYLDRIAEYEGTLNAMISLNPDAVDIAHERDVERAHGDIRGPLHGIPIVLKDNVHTLDMITDGRGAGVRRFAGALRVHPLAEASRCRCGHPGQDGADRARQLGRRGHARQLQRGRRLRDESLRPAARPAPGPRPLGRPFNDGRPVMNTGGSSSGIATAANLAAGNVGTETSGSILSPSNQTMLAGIKPTVGLISRYGVIPITADQDTAGPMARDVASAAIMLGVLQGYDSHDPATTPCLTPGNCFDDYTQFLDANGLAGARIGVPQISYYNTLNAAQKAVVDAAIAVIQARGGTVVMTDIPSRVDGTLTAWGICAGAADSKANDDTNCSVVLKYGFKRDFNHWLDSLGAASNINTLAELMAFNLANIGNNAIKYAQTRFDISQEMDLAADAARYAADRAQDIFLTATHGIDEVMAAQDLDALLFGGASSADLGARPGYPTVVVPFGFVPNVPAGIPAGFNPLPQPYGISFTGSAFDEPTLIKLAYAFEQATRQRVSPASAPPLKKDVKGNPNQ